jgi:SAM-dependent methyltransferase
MTRLADIRATWEQLARDDPLWAVLTWPGTRGRRWDRRAFFATGRVEVDRVLAAVDRVAHTAERRLNYGRAMDFGCGVGRCTQALAERFAEVDGVDIAESMIRLARRYNRHGSRVRYYVNAADDLRLFPAETFDFVYSAHVLQHLPPELAAGYAAEVVRVLAPGGLAMLEVATGLVQGPGTALPDGAFAAELTVAEPPRLLAPGHLIPLRVRVVNRSPVAWPAAGRDGWGQVQVGDHWATVDGRRVVVDDARAPLPWDLAPGAACEVVLEVTAPAQHGAWRLEVDLVQEGVAWFADRGSPLAGITLRVGRPRWMRRRPVRPVMGMEMHGMSEATVAQWAAAAGGIVVGGFSWDEVQRALTPDWNRRGLVIARRAGPGLEVAGRAEAAR